MVPFRPSDPLPPTITELSPKPTPSNFFLAWGGGVLVAMSGAFSVPFTIYGLFADSFAQRIVSLTLAIVAAWITGYELWRSERSKLRQLEERLIPRLTLAYGCNRTVKFAGTGRQTYLLASNVSQSYVPGVEVKLIECKVMKSSSSDWEPTHLRTRFNLSWCSRPDGDPHKYAAIQMHPGSEEMLDFISGPYPVTMNDDSMFPQGSIGPSHGFHLKVDPRHGLFLEQGKYKFVLQISGIDCASSQRTLLVERGMCTRHQQIGPVATSKSDPKIPP
jgi:hypothetical protein